MQSGKHYGILLDRIQVYEDTLQHPITFLCQFSSRVRARCVHLKERLSHLLLVEIFHTGITEQDIVEARDGFEWVLNSFPFSVLCMDTCLREPTGRAASMRQGVGFHGG